jgi:hypothetical protein
MLLLLLYMITCSFVTSTSFKGRFYCMQAEINETEHLKCYPDYIEGYSHQIYCQTPDESGEMKCISGNDQLTLQ